MKKVGKFLLKAVLTLIGSFIIGYLITSFIKAKTIVWNVDYLFDTTTLAIAGGVVLVVLIMMFNKFDADKPSSTKGNKVVDDKGNKVQQYYSTKWVSLED